MKSSVTSVSCSKSLFSLDAVERDQMHNTLCCSRPTDLPRLRRRGPVRRSAESPSQVLTMLSTAVIHRGCVAGVTIYFAIVFIHSCLFSLEGLCSKSSGFPVQPPRALPHRQRRLLPQLGRQPHFARIAFGPPAQLALCIWFAPFGFCRIHLAGGGRAAGGWRSAKMMTPAPVWSRLRTLTPTCWPMRGWAWLMTTIVPSLR